MSDPIVFLFNQEWVQTAAHPGTLLLDFIRGERGLTGTKAACREGDCGSCAVLLGHLQDGRLVYQAVNACLLPLGAAAGRHVVSIEGINSTVLNPLQKALVANGAIQCGFCTPGLVIALTAFFLSAAECNKTEALDAVAGNLCRCTGYAGIKRALQQLCADYEQRQSARERRLEELVAWGVVPAYFLSVSGRLLELPPPDSTQDAGDILIAGGTDLAVQHPQELQTRTLRFIAPVTARPIIRYEGGQCFIDAAANVEALRTSTLLQQACPGIKEDFKLICSAPVRQRATVGGNFVNASPIGDLSVFFLALDAQLNLQSGAGQRRAPLRQFFQSYKQTALQTGERVTALSFDCARNLQVSFEKVAKRRYLDIASVNSALALTQTDGVITRVHLAMGGVAAIPLYLKKTSAYLSGQPIQAASVRAAAGIMQSEIAPIDDIRGSAAYKRLLARQLLYAHFLKLFPHLIRWEDLHVAD